MIFMVLRTFYVIVSFTSLQFPAANKGLHWFIKLETIRPMPPPPALTAELHHHATYIPQNVPVARNTTTICPG